MMPENRDTVSEAFDILITKIRENYSDIMREIENGTSEKTLLQRIHTNDGLIEAVGLGCDGGLMVCLRSEMTQCIKRARFYAVHTRRLEANSNPESESAHRAYLEACSLAGLIPQQIPSMMPEKLETQ